MTTVSSGFHSDGLGYILGKNTSSEIHHLTPRYQTDMEAKRLLHSVASCQPAASQLLLYKNWSCCAHAERGRNMAPICLHRRL